jgi:hypothetical protein
MMLNAEINIINKHTAALPSLYHDPAKISVRYNP